MGKMQRKIKKGGFSPRELIEKSGVVCVCTTDDPADTLEYHKLLAKDKSFHAACFRRSDRKRLSV